MGRKPHTREDVLQKILSEAVSQPNGCLVPTRPANTLVRASGTVKTIRQWVYDGPVHPNGRIHIAPTCHPDCINPNHLFMPLPRSRMHKRKPETIPPKTVRLTLKGKPWPPTRLIITLLKGDPLDWPSSCVIQQSGDPLQKLVGARYSRFPACPVPGCINPRHMAPAPLKSPATLSIDDMVAELSTPEGQRWAFRYLDAHPSADIEETWRSFHGQKT